MCRFIFGLCPVSLVYLPPSHNISVLEFYKKSSCPIALTPVLFFIKIILTFLGPSSLFASWCITTPHILQCSLKHLNFLISGSVDVVPSLFFPLLLCLASPTHSLGLSVEFTVPRLPLSGISQCILFACSLNWLHKLLSPVQNDSVRLFVLKWFRISRQ